MSVPTRPAAAPEQVVRTAVRWSRGIVGAALVVGVCATALLPVPVATAVTMAVAAAGLVAGLPHGAVDHRLAAQLSGRSPIAVALVYGATAVLAWLVLVAAGPLALGAVVLLSVIHFGLGEVQIHRMVDGSRLGRVVSASIAVAGTGALLLPLARSGDVLTGVAMEVSPGVAAALAGGPLRVGLAAVWLVAATVAVSAALSTGHRTILADVALLGALGAFAPPLLAFGVWFGGWHSLRHGGRLLLTEPGCAALVAAGRNRDAVCRLLRMAAWPSVAAVATLGLLIAFTVTAADTEAAIAEVLRVLLALTVPHMLVIGWLDRHER